MNRLALNRAVPNRVAPARVIWAPGRSLRVCIPASPPRGRRGPAARTCRQGQDAIRNSRLLSFLSSYPPVTPRRNRVKEALVEDMSVTASGCFQTRVMR